MKSAILLISLFFWLGACTETGFVDDRTTWMPAAGESNLTGDEKGTEPSAEDKGEPIRRMTPTTTAKKKKVSPKRNMTATATATAKKKKKKKKKKVSPKKSLTATAKKTKTSLKPTTAMLKRILRSRTATKPKPGKKKTKKRKRKSPLKSPACGFRPRGNTAVPFLVCRAI